MKHLQKPIAKLIPSLDYIHVVCEKCGETCGVDYKGLDPSIPLIEVTCPKCGDLGTWKLEGAGAGFYDKTID
jgi:predicted nucleic-acid-binding Zn-ribbon protein